MIFPTSALESFIVLKVDIYILKHLSLLIIKLVAFTESFSMIRQLGC